jgi:CRISPR-associated endonuclease Cas1
MAASSTLPQETLSSKPPINRSGVLTLFGYGIKVRMQAGHLEIEDGIGPDRRKIRLARVGHGLQRLVILGADGFVSLAGLRWLADQDASFTMLDADGRVLMASGPVRPSEAKLRRSQALAHHTGAALRITQELIARKLKGQEQVARHHLLDAVTADIISHFEDELPAAESVTSVRLIESQAALAYWSAWRNLPINFPKNDLNRVPDHWRCFGARISPLTGSPRLSVNPANAILNYLYAILESEARLAAVALGLDPGLGVLHADTANRDSLALDVLEPIRPQVDAYVLDWITKQSLRREWFAEQRNGNCRLTAALAVQLSESANVWRRAVAPIAEWVAQALWDSTRKQAVVKGSLPTRLIQRRRSEGRGREFSARMVPAPFPSKVCAECGATTKRGRHCMRCAKAVSGKKLIELAKTGRIVTLGADAQRKRSETQRRHEAGKRNWRNSSVANSVSDEMYRKEIQPRLASITIAKIASTLGVSEPYATDIRSGRRRPHPRHWQELAKIVGSVLPAS